MYPLFTVLARVRFVVFVTCLKDYQCSASCKTRMEKKGEKSEMKMGPIFGNTLSAGIWRYSMVMIRMKRVWVVCIPPLSDAAVDH